jgi:hypothetical protein
MDCGELEALSVMFTVAERASALPGVKTTLIVQDFPALTVLPQVLVCAKLAAFAPESAMVTPVRSALPPLVSETLCAAEDDPTA